MILPGETEAGSAGMQPCRGIPWRAHRDDDRKRGNQLLALRFPIIGSKDPDALKIPARRAEFTLTENASSPFHAEPAHLYQLVEAGDETGEKHKRYISGAFEITGNLCDVRGDSYSVVLTWRDDRHRKKQEVLPLSQIMNGGKEVCGLLVDRGLRIHDPRLFLRYVWDRSSAAPKAHLTKQVGWFNEQYFVLPDLEDGMLTKKKRGSTGAIDGMKVIYAPLSSEEPEGFRTAGTLDDWREHVGERCVGNSRLVLAVCCAFAGPLLKPTGDESGGVHLVTGSSKGKTTTQTVAGSVAGGGPKRYVRSWRSTTNALELSAAEHNDALLALDELAHVRPEDAIEAVYMLANATAKTRMKPDGSARRTAQWRVILLSSGETTLSEHAGTKTRGGSEVRLLNIDADAGRGMGAFEDLHGTEPEVDSAGKVVKSAPAVFGAPILRDPIPRICAPTLWDHARGPSGDHRQLPERFTRTMQTRWSQF